MKYGSVCSGIEAATSAWHSLGWEPVFFSEIEPFPSAVLAHHYPDVPNYGDMTKFKEWPDAVIDVLVGGTPCQSFSVAGLRKGLDDPRGNLMLTYLAIATRYRPQWLVWENVPGVLSSNGGADFAALLRGMEECGYGLAYRILDAQYFGVAQRRRRVFVVGCLGSWQRAAAVLFERHSLSGHPAPSREKGKRVAPTVTNGPPFSRTGNERVECEAMIPTGTCSNKDIFPSLMANVGTKLWLGNQEALSGDYHVFGIPGNWIGRKPENGGNATEPMHDVAPSQTVADRHAVAFTQCDAGRDFGEEVSMTLRSGGAGGYPNHSVATSMQVRRLTPVECERLQGFPDNHTRIPWRNKTAEDCPDGPRYKALGNSMAVPVMHWIGKRIQACNNIKDTTGSKQCS